MLSYAEKKEQRARANEAVSYGVVLNDLQKAHTDHRAVLCLVRGLLIFLAVYGTIGGLVASFGLPFSVPVVALSLLALSLFSAFIYYNKLTFYTGYVIVFLLLIAVAFIFYLYINSGFQAFLNELTNRYTAFFDLPPGLESEEQITDRHLTVSAMMIFVGGVFSIFFNITIAGYMDLPMTFLVSFLPLQAAFYIDIVPPKIYLVMLLTVYLSVAILGRSGHFTLPYRYKKDQPFGRKRTKSVEQHFYQASGSGMLTLTGIALLFSVVFLFIVGGVFDARFSTKNVSNGAKDFTDRYVKIIASGGVTALFNRYEATGGLSHGRIGGIRSVSPDFETDLLVRFVPTDTNVIYLKGYTGVYYRNNEFYPSLPESAAASSDVSSGSRLLKDGVLTELPGYVPYIGTLYAEKMEITNVDADPDTMYLPYMPEGASAESLLRPQTLPINETVSLLYLPFRNAAYYGESAEDYPENPYLTEDYEKEIKAYYRFYPESLSEALAETAEAAGLTEETDPLLMAKKLKSYFDSEFHYTMTPGAAPYDRDAVEYFLTQQKRGYCALFASSAALVLRQQGVPTRYCEGYVLRPSDVNGAAVVDHNAAAWEYLFTSDSIFDETLSYQSIADIRKQAEEESTEGELTLEDSVGWLSAFGGGTEAEEDEAFGAVEVELPDANAHAWIELWIDGFGWVPYEVTPPVDDEELSIDFSGLFAGLFSQTVRNAAGNGDASDAAGGALPSGESTGGLLSRATMTRLSEKMFGSAGYLFLPFLWMFFVCACVLAAYFLWRRLYFEARRALYLRRGDFGAALLLCYRREVRRMNKADTRYPTVHDAVNQMPLTKKEHTKLEALVSAAAFSAKALSEKEYRQGERLLKKADEVLKKRRICDSIQAYRKATRAADL